MIYLMILNFVLFHKALRNLRRPKCLLHKTIVPRPSFEMEFLEHIVFTKIRHGSKSRYKPDILQLFILFTTLTL